MWIILHYFIALILWLITVSIQNGSFLQCYNLKKIVSFKLLKIGHDYIRYSSVGKEYAWRAGDLSSIPGSGRSSGEGIGCPFQYSWASLVSQLVKSPLQRGRPGFSPWVGKIPWRRERLPTPVFWPGEVMDCIVQGVAKSRTPPRDFHVTGFVLPPSDQ